MNMIDSKVLLIASRLFQAFGVGTCAFEMAEIEHLKWKLLHKIN